MPLDKDQADPRDPQPGAADAAMPDCAPDPPAPASPFAPKLQLTIQLVLAARRWRALLDERLRPIGQSAARMEAMSAIAHSPPFSPQIEIARRIGIEGATLTRMIDALEADGLVERLAHPTDRRTKLVRVTAAGHQSLRQINRIAGELREHLLGAIGDEGVDEANGLLALLLDRLDADFPNTAATAAD